MLIKCVLKLCISPTPNPTFQKKVNCGGKDAKPIQIEAGRHPNKPNGRTRVAKGIKWNQKGAQWRQDGTQSNQMEPTNYPKASKLHQKGTQSEQNKAQSGPKPPQWTGTATKMEPKVS